MEEWVKGKRRSKLRMPLKKIPKRKQNTLTERINMCQDIGHFDLPENLSALIVTSVQGEGENRLPHTPTFQPPQKKLPASDTCCLASSSSPGNTMAHYSRSSDAVEKSCKQPLPPLVSISRPSASKAPSLSALSVSKNTPATSVFAGGMDDVTNRLGRHATTASGSSVFHSDSLTSVTPNHLPSLPQTDTLLRGNCNHHIFQGCDNGTLRSSPLSSKQPYELAAPNGSPGQLYVHPMKSSEAGGLLKVMKPTVQTEGSMQSEKALLHCELTDENIPPSCKSRACFKPSVKLYKQYASDMRIPLVHVKPPLLTPISPERKKGQVLKKPVPTTKQNAAEGSDPTPGVGLARGRRQNDKSTEAAERNWSERKKRLERSCSSSKSSQGSATDDDDVIITGVVNLNDLPHGELAPLSNLKHLLTPCRRRNSKCDEINRTDNCFRPDCESSIKFVRLVENLEHCHGNTPRQEHCHGNTPRQEHCHGNTPRQEGSIVGNRKKQICKRGGYSRKTTKKQRTVDDSTIGDLDIRHNHLGHVSFNQNKTETVGNDKCDLLSDSVRQNSKVEGHKSELNMQGQKPNRYEPYPNLTASSSGIISEIDEQQRNEHFSTIINAIKKEDDLIKSSINRKVKVTKMKSNRVDSVDWRSWLTIFDKNSTDSTGNSIKAEVVEIGSGTDSGNEDDLILRDLSEFLLLSEDRRHSRKNSFDNAALKDFTYSKRSTFSGNNFYFDESKINFDSIDSSINFINSIDTDANDPLKDLERRTRYTDEDNGVNFEDNKYYSKWQSVFDNYPKYPIQNRYKNRSENYWRRFMLTERNPMLVDADHYEHRPAVTDKDRRLEESATKAGLILRSESAERGIAPSYESKFYKKRIYRKKSKIIDFDHSW